MSKKRTDWKRGRFIYNDDFGYWICTGCGYRIAEETMEQLAITPPCPFCDRKPEKPMIYRDLEEVIDSE